MLKTENMTDQEILSEFLKNGFKNMDCNKITMFFDKDIKIELTENTENLYQNDSDFYVHPIFENIYDRFVENTIEINLNTLLENNLKLDISGLGFETLGFFDFCILKYIGMDLN